jgi:hypothetical protein
MGDCWIAAEKIGDARQTTVFSRVAMRRRGHCRSSIKAVESACGDGRDLALTGTRSAVEKGKQNLSLRNAGVVRLEDVLE